MSAAELQEDSEDRPSLFQTENLSRKSEFTIYKDREEAYREARIKSSASILYWEDGKVISLSRNVSNSGNPLDELAGQEPGDSPWTPDATGTRKLVEETSSEHTESGYDLNLILAPEPTTIRSDKKGDDMESEASGRSGASSIASITKSIFSMVSGSSMSSIVGPQSAVERLVILLLNDSVIKSLCTDALFTLVSERFERNLRRLLKEFAVGLRREAESEQERHTAQFVRLRARNSAYIICTTLSKKKKEQGEVDVEVGYVSEESDSDRSDDEVDDLQQLERFIKSSQAIETLRENLRAFVHPEYYSVPSGNVDDPKKPGERSENDGTANENQDFDSLRPGQADLHSTQAASQPKQSYPTMDDFEIHHRGRQRERRSELASVNTSPHGERTPHYNIVRGASRHSRTPMRYPDTVTEDYRDDGYGYMNPQDLVRYDLSRTSGLGTTTHNLDDSRLSRRPSLPTHVELRSSSKGQTIEAKRDRAHSGELNVVQHPRPPSHDPLRAQGFEAGQVEEPHNEEVEESTIESTEKLEIFQEPPIRPKWLEMGKILGGFSTGLSLFTASGTFLNRKPATMPEWKTIIA
jgi:hypothetical protein